CYLSEQHRQEDPAFLRLLSSIRQGTVTEEDGETLSRRRVGRAEEVPGGALKLYTHNVDVDRINEKELEGIAGAAETFCMTASGKKSLIETLKRGCLSPEALLLKKGASVMFTKNHQQGMYVNGTLGTVTDFDKYSGYPLIKTRDGRRVVAEPADWSVEEHGRMMAKVTQIPLRLAWAITVHKSQGMSLDAAVVDLSHAFVEGQGYVALSRVRTLAGLSLFGWNEMALTVHPDVVGQDARFRDQSLDSEAVFGAMEKAERDRLHTAFVKAQGGVMPSASDAR
ncbi:MAG: helicase, partial [Patescibacteria group bacterium]